MGRARSETSLTAFPKPTCCPPFLPPPLALSGTSAAACMAAAISRHALRSGASGFTRRRTRRPRLVAERSAAAHGAPTPLAAEARPQNSASALASLLLCACDSALCPPEKRTGRTGVPASRLACKVHGSPEHTTSAHLRYRTSSDPTGKAGSCSTRKPSTKYSPGSCVDAGVTTMARTLAKVNASRHWSMSVLRAGGSAQWSPTGPKKQHTTGSAMSFAKNSRTASGRVRAVTSCSGRGPKPPTQGPTTCTCEGHSFGRGSRALL
mmetsp:Transcript_87564/g.175174  ORF Transcript_87564/g.175174 Transcript_87564/m.175174 type:complete len:265 (-) Transcript_87564:786-1580(-)